MEQEEYLRQLEALLRAGHLPPAELEDALDRCRRYIGRIPGQEAQTIASLHTPEQMAAEILADYRRTAAAKGGLSVGLKLVLAVTLSPFIVAAYSAVLGLIGGGAACIVPGLISIAVGLGASLSGGVATLLVFLGGGLAAIGAGLLLLVGGIALCQGSNWCMRRIFSGRRT